jgi:photosystem II stability/assembly factor-like uncharacterized protein
MKKRILTSVILTTIATTVMGQTEPYRWIKYDALPDGGHIKQLAYDNAGTIYALTDHHSQKSSIFYSEDKGDTWRELPGHGFLHNQTSIEVDKVTGTLYVGTLYRGLLWTSNKGTTWSNERFYTMPTSGMNAYIATIGKNHGSNTIICNEPSIFNISTIRISTNGGATWTQVAAPFGVVNDFHFLPDGAVLAGTEWGVYISEDNGTNWLPRNTGIHNLMVTSIYEEVASGDIYISANKHSVLNDTTGAGIYKSTNAGLSWERISGGLTDYRVNHVTLDSAGNIYAATPTGIFRSNNEGISWTADNAGLPLPNANNIISKDGYAFASSANYGVARRTISSSSWATCNNGIKTTATQGLIFYSPTHYVTLNQSTGVHIKHAGTWTQNIADLPKTGAGELIAQGNGDTLYAAFRELFSDLDIEGGIFRSIDKGLNWQYISENFPNEGIYSNIYKKIEVGESGAIYVFVSRGGDPFGGDPSYDEILKSTDGGITWTSLFKGLILEMVLDHNEHLYVQIIDEETFDAKYIHSEDHISFENFEIDVPLVSSGAYVDRVELYPDNEGKLYLKDLNMLYKQTETGWESIPDLPWPTGMWEYNQVRLTFDLSNQLYALVAPDGIFRSSDEGATWENISTNIPSVIHPYFGSSMAHPKTIAFAEDNTPYYFNFHGADSTLAIYKYTNEVLAIPSTVSESKEINVYPNPTSSTFSYELSIEQPVIARVDLFSIDGRMISSENKRLTTGKNKGSINLNTMPTGTYVLRIATAEGSFSCNIVKQ